MISIGVKEFMTNLVFLGHNLCYRIGSCSVGERYFDIKSDIFFLNRKHRNSSQLWSVLAHANRGEDGAKENDLETFLCFFLCLFVCLFEGISLPSAPVNKDVNTINKNPKNEKKLKRAEM